MAVVMEMAVISYKKLNDKLQESLAAGKVPEKNVREISAQLKAQSKRELKTAAIITGVIAVVFGGMLTGLIINTKDMQENMLWWIIGYLALMGFIFLAGYMMSVGIIKLEFNSAIKEGYPELYKECKV